MSLRPPQALVLSAIKDAFLVEDRSLKRAEPGHG